MGCSRQGGTLLLEFALGLGDIVKDTSAARGTEGKYVALIIQLLLQSWGSMMRGIMTLNLVEVTIKLIIIAAALMHFLYSRG